MFLRINFKFQTGRFSRTRKTGLLFFAKTGGLATGFVIDLEQHACLVIFLIVSSAANSKAVREWMAWKYIAAGPIENTSKMSNF